jgi:hypothetical protein
MKSSLPLALHYSVLPSDFLMRIQIPLKVLAHLGYKLSNYFMKLWNQKKV